MKRPQYTPEFQDEAVRQVLDGQETLARIARNLSIRDNTLATWKKTTRKGHGDPAALRAGEELSQTERARLRRENQQLKLDQEPLQQGMGIVARAR